MPSERANKASGVCSHCLATRQPHLGTGTVHLHGPRNHPCPGSNLPPLTVVNNSSARRHPGTGPPTPLTPAGQLQGSCGNDSVEAQLSQVCDPAGPRETVSHSEADGPILKHIVKGARLACSQALTEVLQNISSRPSALDTWRALLQFAPCILAQPPRAGRKRNLANVIKSRVDTWSRGQGSSRVKGPVGVGSRISSHNSDAFIAAINSKLEDGNIRAAVRILCDQSQPAPPSEENMQILLDKHPVDPNSDDLLNLPDPAVTTPFQVTESEVMEAIRSFPTGSAGGPDGFRPGHLLELVNHRETSAALLSALTDFVNLLLRGGCPSEVRPILFGGGLIALSKKSGGLRPIAIGYVWRRIAAKCANKYAVKKLSSFFAPLQVGIATPAGCEAAVHSARRFIDAMPQDHIFVKLDFVNAFNSLRRDVMHKAAFETIPEIYRFVHQAYGAASVLRFGQFSISSQMGPQQGDPLGPLLFCLPLQPILRSLQSTFRMGYLDDLTLGGHQDTVARDIELISDLGSTMGLHLNHSKCELFSPGRLDDSDNLSWSNFQHLDRDALTLLGAPLFKGQALDMALEQHCVLLYDAIQNLHRLPSQSAIILLRSSFGAPRISHLLRCSPCCDHPTLERLDNTMREGLESIVNVKLDNTQWLQATLPIRHGGLGMRRVVSLASSAYLASAATTFELQSAILGLCPAVCDSHLADLLAARRETLPPCVDPLPTKQVTWDGPVIEMDKSVVWACAVKPTDRARLAAVSCPHSSDWLTALPISSCGLCLDNEAVRVAVGLRLGLDLCSPHQCRCGDLVGPDGHHGLVCRLAFGRSIRHYTINDIVWRALQKADVPSTKEPTGLFRSDGKRPDGATMVPWEAGKYLAWDATVIHTCAASYIAHTANSAGAAAEQAAIHKSEKYSGLPSTHLFLPIALETLGPINSAGVDFIREVGRRLSTISGESREVSFLFQRLSICIQRFNAIAFRGTFPDVVEDEA